MSRKRKQLQQSPTRREFLWKNACAALTATSMLSTIRDLRMIKGAMAGSPPVISKKVAPTGQTNSSYKAMVCIFLFGGNDGNNILVPTDTTTYNQYVTARVAAASGGLAIPAVGQQYGLLALNPLSNDGHTYGIHPAMAEIQALFNSGKAAIVANCGTLLAPLTKTQYQNNSVAKPPQLFSHNDQQVEWQTSVEDQAPVTGWGGRAADLLYAANSGQNVSMNMSIAGSNTYEVGGHVYEYNLSSNGATPIQTASGAQLQALNNVLGLNHGNLYESAFTNQMSIALTDASLISTAINATSSSSYWNTPFPNTGIGQQLQMIARLMQGAPILGHTYQIFFAAMGGFDLHGSEGASIPGQNAQGSLLQQLSQGMNALYQATSQLGIASQVVQFTASDFSRTFAMNSINGADHGWGNNHLVVGGAVNGQRIYGTYPNIDIYRTGGSPDDVGTGRWIPTTSVDQYAATLASWFGVSGTNINTIFPYLSRFSPQNLGFI